MTKGSEKADRGYDPHCTSVQREAEFFIKIKIPEKFAKEVRWI